MSRRYGGGQTESAPYRDLPDGIGEGWGGDVVAFICDHEAVPGGKAGDVVAAGQGLQGDDVDGAAQLCPAAAELPGLDAEEPGDPGPPLVSQGLAVDQDQRGGPLRRDDRASDHGLARPGRRVEHPEVVPGQLRGGSALGRCQGGRKRELLRCARRALVGDDRAAACLGGEIGDGAEHAARKDQAAVEDLVVGVHEAGDVVGGGTHPLPLVGQWVVHRRGVPQRRGQPWGQLCLLDPDPGLELGTKDSCGLRLCRGR